MKIKSLVQKNLDVLLYATICFVISGSISALMCFFKIKDIETKLEKKFLTVNTMGIEKLLQKIDTLPEILFESAADEKRCKEKVKFLSDNEFYQVYCGNNVTENSISKNNAIILKSSQGKAYEIIIELYIDALLNNLKDLYEKIELGTVQLLYDGKEMFLQKKEQNIKETKICASQDTCLVLGYGNSFISKVKSEIMSEYLVMLLLIELAFVLRYAIFKRQCRYFVFSDLSKSKKTLSFQVKKLKGIIADQQSVIKKLQKKEESLNNSASFQVMWMSLLNKNLKESMMKIAFKEKDNFELHSYLLSLVKKGDVLKVCPQEIKDNILKLGGYIALSSDVKVDIRIKRSSIIEIYIHEVVFLNILYSLAYNIFRKCMAKTELKIEINRKKSEFIISFTGSVMNIQDNNHPVFENFNKIKSMTQEAGGDLKVKKLLSGQSITLAFPIANNSQENSKIINIKNLVSEGGVYVKH